MKSLKLYIKDILKFFEFLSLQRKSTGKICVFRCRDGNPGLFSYVVHVLGFVRYAHRHNLIPVVDMQTYKNTYLTDEYVDIYNAWEYFFEQPYKVRLCDLENKDIEVFDTQDPKCNGLLKMPWWDWECFDESSMTCKMWRAYTSKYIRLSGQAQQMVTSAYSRSFNKNDRVLGVLCRGTDYARYKPKDHPVQPTAEMVIDKANELIKKYNYNKVFLATEDKDIYEKFKVFFGDILISFQQNQIRYDGIAWINNTLPDSQQEKVTHGMNYLVSMAILANCNGFIAGRTSGSIGVMLMSKGFEYSYFWDLGFYE